MTKLVKVFCKKCEKSFYRSERRYNENIKLGHNFYCSRKCEYSYKTTKKLLICGNCGKSFLRELNGISLHNYCSQTCAAIVNNRNRPDRGGKTKTCENCGKKFKKWWGNKKYCSIQCQEVARSKRNPQWLIDIIKSTVKKLKRVPSKRELKGIVDSCIRHFGSWNNAIIAAGFNPNRSHNQRMYKRTTAKAVDGHICDSVSELLIDNWLTKNKIKHERNAPYPNTNHRSDWVVNLQGETIFVEYFGLAKDSPRYDRSIRKKKSLCQKYKIKLLEVYPWDLYPGIKLDDKLKVLKK